MSEPQPTEPRGGGEHPAAATVPPAEGRVLQQRLEHRIAVEEVIAEVTTRLITADPAAAGADVTAALGKVAEALGADGAGFLRSDGTAERTHFLRWAAEGSGRTGEGPASVAGLAQRWWERSLRSGEVFRCSSLDELGEDPEAAANRDFLVERGIQSFIVVPLPAYGSFAGFVGLFATREPRTFDDDVVALLRVAGEVFLSALDRADSAAAAAAATRELAIRNLELERSNEELAAFADRAAHDLKDPLARIQQALELLARVAELDDTAAEVLAVALRGASGLQRLIADLLTFTKVGEQLGPAEPIALDAVAAEVVADLAEPIKEVGARVEVSELAVVEAHPTLIRLLLQNLVANAVKFARPGIPPVVLVSSETSPEGTTLTVADNGIGIPPEHRTVVFEMMKRLQSRERYDGSGIGLATAAKIAAHHGGEIWIDDGIDGGTAVRVRFPPPGGHE